MTSMRAGTWQALHPYRLDPVLLTFDHQRAAQKIKLGGEFSPAQNVADHQDTPFLEFFQVNRDTGHPKGIIALDLGGFP